MTQKNVKQIFALNEAAIKLEDAIKQRDGWMQNYLEEADKFNKMEAERDAAQAKYEEAYKALEPFNKLQQRYREERDAANAKMAVLEAALKGMMNAHRLCCTAKTEDEVLNCNHEADKAYKTALAALDEVKAIEKK